MTRKSIQHILLILATLGCFEAMAQESAKIERTKLNKEIDLYVDRMMKVHKIPGMAVAVIGKSGMVHKGFYGKTSLEDEKPVTDQTVFKIFSLTKTMVATSVFKLIEEGEISLDDGLSDYFDVMPRTWQNVTIGHLLSHSSGLPDIRGYTNEFEDDQIDSEEFIRLLFDDEMDFATGAEWSYNQTNYLLLGRIIEKVSKTSFEGFISEHQFPHSDSTSVFLSSGPTRDRPNMANYYDFDKESNSYRGKPGFSGRKNLPLAGINITLDEYILWNDRLEKDELIAEPTKKAMWSSFHFTNSHRKFLYGWDVYELNGSDSYGFSGGGVSGFRKFLDQDLSIIVLTTGFRYYPVHDIVIDYIAGIVDKSLEDKESALKEEIMTRYFLTNTTVKNLKDMVLEVKSAHPGRNLEEVFKSVGYGLYFSLGRKQEAIRLFELNVAEYPESYDTYGSLAYLQYLSNMFKESRENYTRAQELNPANGYSARMIGKINALQE